MVGDREAWLEGLCCNLDMPKQPSVTVCCCVHRLPALLLFTACVHTRAPAGMVHSKVSAHACGAAHTDSVHTRVLLLYTGCVHTRACRDGAAKGKPDGEGVATPTDLPFLGSDHLGEVERQRSALETLDADVQVCREWFQMESGFR